MIRRTKVSQQNFQEFPCQFQQMPLLLHYSHPIRSQIPLLDVKQIDYRGTLGPRGIEMLNTKALCDAVNSKNDRGNYNQDMVNEAPTLWSRLETCENIV